mmetsp:Transcript_15088/g.22225  ORF Transcript_15088/g.22225 Transcript_15088/m.22225 type:complete len:198 (+) Transcript_15088:85-678(+)
MSGYGGEPDWATPGGTANTSAASPPSAGAPTSNNASNLAPRSGGANAVQRILSILVIGICAMMAAVAVLGIIQFDWTSVTSYTDLFVAIYMLLFSILLFIYEVMWWKSIPALNRSLRKNFGFLYGIKGKAIFIIFVAFLNFGLENEVSVPHLSLATGITFFAVAVLHLFIAFWKPQLVESYQAPSAGFSAVSSGQNV